MFLIWEWFSINETVVNTKYTPDLPQRGLAGEDSHTNINTLLQTKNNHDRRSILIDENTMIGQRRTIINDNIYKPSVFDRLGSGKINPTKTNKDSEEQRNPNQWGKHTNSSHNQDRGTNQHRSQLESNRKFQNSQQKSTPDPRQRGLAGEGEKQKYNKNSQGKTSDGHSYNREPERYGREEKA